MAPRGADTDASERQWTRGRTVSAFFAPVLNQNGLGEQPIGSTLNAAKIYQPEELGTKLVHQSPGPAIRRAAKCMHLVKAQLVKTVIEAGSSGLRSEAAAPKFLSHHLD